MNLTVGLLLVAGPSAWAADAGATPDAEATPDARLAAPPPAGASKTPYVGRPAAPLPRLAEDDGVGRVALIIPIQGTIDMGLPRFLDRALAEHPEAAVVILDVDTFGGRVDAAVHIRDALLSTSLPVVAFVNRRAISAGALISLAADHIVFTTGGSMGAATPIQMEGGQAKAVGEKMVSYMRSEMRATAEAKGRDGRLAEAMVDADVELTGVIKEGKLLTLATDQALELGLANARQETLEDLLTALGLGRAKVVRAQTNWAERVARFLTDPTVSGLLMSLGMLGLLVELYTPGFGLAGAVGVSCLMLFFGGHMVVDLAGWEELALFGLGLAALGVEIFIIPGFGVVGVAGVALMAGAMILAMLGLPLGVSWEVGAFSSALSTVLLALTGTTLALVALVRYLPSGGLGRWLVLETTLGHAEADAPDAAGWVAPADRRHLVGQEGEALTDLRPSGKARVEGELLDVVSAHSWVARGATIRVIEVEGVRVVVEERPEVASAEVHG